MQDSKTNPVLWFWPSARRHSLHNSVAFSLSLVQNICWLLNSRCACVSYFVAFICVLIEEVFVKERHEGQVPEHHVTSWVTKLKPKIITAAWHSSNVAKSINALWLFLLETPLYNSLWNYNVPCTKPQMQIFNWGTICFHVNKGNVPAAKLLQLWRCATSKCFMYESGILFHNEAAIRIEQTASSYKRLRQQHGENILMTNYILRCANGLFSKLWLLFNPVSKEQYYFRIPHRSYGLFYMTQISGLFSFSYAVNSK